jgi:hypothetical protein
MSHVVIDCTHVCGLHIRFYLISCIICGNDSFSGVAIFCFYIPESKVILTAYQSMRIFTLLLCHSTSNSLSDVAFIITMCLNTYS